MSDLSPAAQAVLKATWKELDYAPRSHAQIAAAAALRAAADQVVPEEHEIIDNCWYEKTDTIREQFLAIAAELEGQQ